MNDDLNNSILLLNEPERTQALKALKEQQLQVPISRTEYLYQSLCSLYWLSPIGFIHNKEKHKTCWELVSI